MAPQVIQAGAKGEGAMMPSSLGRRNRCPSGHQGSTVLLLCLLMLNDGTATAEHQDLQALLRDASHRGTAAQVRIQPPEQSDLHILSSLSVPGRVSKVYAISDSLYLVSTRRDGAPRQDGLAFDVGMVTNHGTYTALAACSGQGDLWRVSPCGSPSLLCLIIGWEDGIQSYQLDVSGPAPVVRGPVKGPPIGGSAVGQCLFPAGEMGPEYHGYTLALDPLPAIPDLAIGPGRHVILEAMPDGLLLATEGRIAEWSLSLHCPGSTASVWTRAVSGGMPTLLATSPRCSSSGASVLVSIAPSTAGPVENLVLDVLSGQTLATLEGPIVRAIGLQNGSFACLSTSGARRTERGPFCWSIAYLDSCGVVASCSSLFGDVAAEELQETAGILVANQGWPRSPDESHGAVTCFYDVASMGITSAASGDLPLSVLTGVAAPGYWKVTGRDGRVAALAGVADGDVRSICTASLTLNHGH